MTRRSRTTAILSLVVLALTGCTSTNIVSNKSESYNGSLDRVLLVTQFATTMADYESTFGPYFSELLANEGVEVEVLRLGGLELEMTSPIERAREIGANIILTVGQTESQRVTDGGLMSNRTYVFDASLIDLRMQQRVWRAHVTTKGDSYTTQTVEARGMARRMVERLREDGLLPMTSEVLASE